MINWHLAMEDQMDLHKWHLSKEGHLLTSHFFHSLLKRGADEMGMHEALGDYKKRESLYEKYASGVTECLWQADTIYLTRDMEEVVLQAAHDLPIEAVCLDDHLLLCKTGFMVLETPIHGKDVSGVEAYVGAIGWEFCPAVKVYKEVESGDYEVIEKDMVYIYFFEPQDSPSSVAEKLSDKYREAGITVPPYQLSHFYPLGRSAEMVYDAPIQIDADNPGSGLVLETLRLFVAMNLVAQQRIGVVDRQRPPRATRKRAERWDPEEGPSKYISLIQLRKKKAVNNEEPKTVDWTHRWIVGGHWRHQWYPSLQRHEWVYIYEHVKGPENLPLVVRERRVFNFAR
jgi:hypothetical protein